MATDIGDFDQGSNQYAQLMELIRGRVSRQQFSTWFEPTTLDSWKGGTLVVGLPNRFYQEWFESKFVDLIRLAAQEVAQAPVQLAFRVLPQPTEGSGAPEGDGQHPTKPAPERYAPEPFAGTGAEDAPLRLNSHYSFENFIVGPSNSVAYASAKGVVDDPGRSYNPLFIHGAVGLGKTHLLHAICQEFLRRAPQERICFLSCEEFTNEFVRALQRNDVDRFRDRFRNVHLLVIDDIHFLKGKERTQEEFFNTFNRLHQSKRQIVLSSDAAPSEIPTLEERLVSRFQWGLVTNLDQPEMETRMAIIRRKAELFGLSVPNDVVEFIASNFRNNIRELEGALQSVRARADVMKVPIDLAVAKEALGPTLRNGQPAVTLDKITQLVCSNYQVKVSDLRSKRRGRSVSEPRQVVMYLARRVTNLSLDEIGDHFGGRDHSTVLYAVRKVHDRVETDPSFAARVDRFLDRLGAS